MTVPELTISEPVVLFSDSDTYAAFPSVAPLSDGGILLAFRAVHDDRYLQAETPELDRMRHLAPRSQLYVQRFGPDLSARSRPELFPPDPAAADQDANLTVLSNGNILLHSFAWKPLPLGLLESARAARWAVGYEPRSGSAAIAWGVFISCSADEGRTWTPRRYVSALPDAPEAVAGVRARRGSFTRGQMAETADGRLLLATYDRDDPSSSVGWRAYLYEAELTDLDFRFRSVIAEPEEQKIGFTETSLIATGDRLVAYLRTAGAQDRLALACSADGGESWTRPVLTEYAGSPCVVLKLDDQHSILFSGMRSRSPMAVGGCITDGDGMPMLETMFQLRSGAVARDFGYPSACLLSDSRILVAYYWCSPTGVREIHANLVDFRRDC